MSAQRTTGSRRRRDYRGCSPAVLLLSLVMGGPALAAASRSPDPEAPIVTNRYADGSALSGGPGPDAATSGSLQGVSAETGADREPPPPMDASVALTAEAPARSSTGAPPIPALPPPPLPAGLQLAALASAPAAAAVASGVGAQIAPAGSGRVLTSIDVPLTLNGRFLGMTSAEVDMAGNGMVDGTRFLALIGPVVTPATLAALRQAAAGRDRLPFTDLNVGGFKLEFASATLELKATAGGDSLVATAMQLTGNRVPPDPTAFPEPAHFSAGANISLAERYVHDGEGATPLKAAIDGIVHWGGFDGVTLVTGADYDESRESGGWRHRETRLIKDFFGPAIRATLGEFTPIADGFQGSGRIVGFGVERAYSSVRPFQNIRPTGRQEFTLDRASTVDVVINGLTTQTLRLAPGRYSVSDFPFATGANQVQLVVDDATGRNEIAVFDIFSGSDLLGKNVVDFGVSAGQYEGSGAFVYDGPVLATGFVRKGFTDNLTLGVNAQASGNAQQIGGEAVWGGRFGLLLLEMAASRDRLSGRSGGAASLSYRQTFSTREADDLRITGTVATTSRYFGDVFQPNHSNTEVWRAGVLVQWNAPWELGLSLGLGMAEGRLGNPPRRQVDFGVGRSFGRVNLVSNISFTNGADDEEKTRFSIGLTVPLGGRWSAQARYDSKDGRSEATIGRYSTGGLNDVSGEARFTNDDRARDVSGRVDYINNRFEAQLTHNRQYDLLDGGRSAVESTLAVRSFIGYAGGSVAIGRPIDDGFIIAPVHRSLADSKVTLVSGTLKVAESGWFGPPLIPIPRAYGVNVFGILVDPLPNGYDIGSGTLNVFPSFGSGYRLQIGSDASRIAVGTLIGADGPLVLATGTIEGGGSAKIEPRPFFTNRSGRFVADRLAPGQYRIMIGGAQVAQFSIPEASEGVVDVGVLHVQSH